MRKILATAFPLLLLLSCHTVDSNIVYGGARSSRYGIEPFPRPGEWVTMAQSISRDAGAEEPALIWIVGEIVSDGGMSLCRLNFPGEKGAAVNAAFSTIDENEAYLDLFDRKGIKVFLQVEPGDAAVDDLIRLVLDRYGHHRCVGGFGVDLEWYRIKGTDGWGTKAGDGEAEYWEKLVKSYDSSYGLFLKHWDARWMPPRYRGDIIFANDSQEFTSVESMKEEFTGWADHFYPNRIFIQTGYEADLPLWLNLENPPGDLSSVLTGNIRQDCGFFWVDFTLRRLF